VAEQGRLAAQDELTPAQCYEWDCCEDNPSLKELIEEILPEGHKYNVTKAKMFEESDIKEENKFATEFTVDVCSKEDTKVFIKDFENKTGTAYSSRREFKSIEGEYTSRRYTCQRNVRDQRSNDQNEGRKRHGSGRLAGTERQPGKNTECEAFITYKLNNCDGQNHNGNYKKCLSVRINYNHNHAISSTDSWNFLGLEEETKVKYFNLFEQGLTPSVARRAYIAELKAKLGEHGYFQIASKRSINPDSTTVFHLNTKYYERFGSMNGPDSYIKAVEQIKKVNENAKEEVASIRQLQNGTVVVAVCDPLMKRTHALVPQSGDVMFVDATGSLDRCNHQVVKFMTASPAGGLPLGFLVLSNHSEEAMNAGIEDLKALMPKEAFFKRGVKAGPRVILTDDDRGEINSLKRAWPTATTLLCQWHVLQVGEVLCNCHTGNATFAE
jgi:hypothetical protein